MQHSSQLYIDPNCYEKFKTGSTIKCCTPWPWFYLNNSLYFFAHFRNFKTLLINFCVGTLMFWVNFIQWGPNKIGMRIDHGLNSSMNIKHDNVSVLSTEKCDPGRRKQMKCMLNLGSMFWHHIFFNKQNFLKRTKFFNSVDHKKTNDGRWLESFKEMENGLFSEKTNKMDGKLTIILRTNQKNLFKRLKKRSFTSDKRMKWRKNRTRPSLLTSFLT